MSEGNCKPLVGRVSFGNHTTRMTSKGRKIMLGKVVLIGEELIQIYVRGKLGRKEKRFILKNELPEGVNLQKGQEVYVEPKGLNAPLGVIYKRTIVS